MAVALDEIARGLVTLLTGVLYVGVGRVILSRDLADDARTANHLFATWWIGLAILYLASAPLTIAGALGFRSYPLTLAFIQAALVALCIAVWGILGFLLYVYRGNHRWLVPTAMFYGALAFGLLFLVSWMEPTGFESGVGTSLAFTRKLGASGSVLIGLAFSVPIFAAALAYASLLFRVTERLPRYRIAMVSGAFAIQFGWSIVRSVTGLSRRFPDSKVLLVANQVLAIAVPLVILMAYRPPTWVAKRLQAAASA
ncbi:MAG TPA: hypothetical protein VM370_03310 [Candidatus Thermoplasmatota archaeon]|nr:hypothetical protein [Candidatus Thermoplasmatota archaeon]